MASLTTPAAAQQRSQLAVSIRALLARRISGTVMHRRETDWGRAPVTRIDSRGHSMSWISMNNVALTRLTVLGAAALATATPLRDVDAQYPAALAGSPIRSAETVTSPS